MLIKEKPTFLWSAKSSFPDEVCNIWWKLTPVHNLNLFTELKKIQKLSRIIQLQNKLMTNVIGKHTRKAWLTDALMYASLAYRHPQMQNHIQGKRTVSPINACP